MGANAWADATSIYERGITNAWAATDVAEGAWSAGTIGDNGLEVTNNIASSLTIAPTSDTSILTWTATWNPGNATGTANNTNAYISFGDVTFAFYGSSWFTKVTIGGTTTQLSGGGATRGRDYIITVTINQTTKQVSYEFNDNGTKLTGTGTTASAGSFTTLTHGLGGKSPNWTNTATLKAVEITEEEYTAATADYTVKYFCGETEIKDAVIRSGEVDAPITLQATDKETFFNSDNSTKYIYSSDDASEKTIASDGSTVVSVLFTEAAQYTYSVKAVDEDNNDLGTIATTTVYSDETAAVSWSKYIKSGDQWYVAKENNFYATSTEAGEKTVAYEKSDIAYFIECEKMNGVRAEESRRTEEYNASWSGNTKIRINRFSTTFYTDIFQEGGVFDLTLFYSNSNGSGHTYKTQLRDGNGDVTDIDTWDCEISKSNATYILNNIIVPAGYSIAIYCDGLSSSSANGNARMDYLTLKQSKVPAAVTSIGCATFCSPYALDFSNATSIKAYTAKVGDDGKITFTNVKTVAAGEGVLLKSKDGKEAEEEIPVIASAEANANNDFVGIPETVQLAQTADGATNYILTKVDDKLGFYMVNTNGSWCKGGTAYLKVSSAKARAFYSLDNDTTTAISDDLVETESDAAVFNLNGQRVTAPQKGLYIVNGKKVVVK